MSLREEPGGEGLDDPVEERIAAMAAELLGEQHVGHDDNFFHLGAHSLLAARLIARVRSLFGVDVSLRRFLALPTVAALGQAVREARVAGVGASPALLPNARAAQALDAAELDVPG